MSVNSKAINKFSSIFMLKLIIIISFLMSFSVVGAEGVVKNVGIRTMSPMDMVMVFLLLIVLAIPLTICYEMLELQLKIVCWLGLMFFLFLILQLIFHALIGNLIAENFQFFAIGILFIDVMFYGCGILIYTFSFIKCCFTKETENNDINIFDPNSDVDNSKNIYDADLKVNNSNLYSLITKLKKFQNQLKPCEFVVSLQQTIDILNEINTILIQNPNVETQLREHINFNIPMVLEVVGKYIQIDKSVIKTATSNKIIEECKSVLDLSNKAFLQLLENLQLADYEEAVIKAQVLESNLKQKGLLTNKQNIINGDVNVIKKDDTNDE